MSAAQEQFAQEAAALIQQAAKMGYTVTLGEAYRTPEQALSNAEHGSGIVNSLHILRLAIDLNFFKEGAWVKDGAALVDIGAWWVARSAAHCWGGNFHTRPDGNHFSISPDGGHTQ